MRDSLSLAQNATSFLFVVTVSQTGWTAHLFIGIPAEPRYRISELDANFPAHTVLAPQCELQYACSCKKYWVTAESALERASCATSDVPATSAASGGAHGPRSYLDKAMQNSIQTSSTAPHLIPPSNKRAGSGTSLGSRTGHCKSNLPSHCTFS